MNTVITFLPTAEIPAFLSQETPIEKLRFAIRTLGKSHNVEYNLAELDYPEEDAEFAEPYASLKGYTIPLLADVRMLVEYLNGIEDAFYVEKSQSWGNICICYIPEKQRI